MSAFADDVAAHEQAAASVSVRRCAMRIGAQVEIARVLLLERRRGGSTTFEKDRHFECVTSGA